MVSYLQDYGKLFAGLWRIICRTMVSYLQDYGELFAGLRKIICRTLISYLQDYGELFVELRQIICRTMVSYLQEYGELYTGHLLQATSDTIQYNTNIFLHKPKCQIWWTIHRRGGWEWPQRLGMASKKWHPQYGMGRSGMSVRNFIQLNITSQMFIIGNIGQLQNLKCHSSISRTCL